MGVLRVVGMIRGLRRGPRNVSRLASLDWCSCGGSAVVSVAVAAGTAAAAVKVGATGKSASVSVHAPG